MKELFKDWHDTYQMSEDLEDWEKIEPKGKELW